MLGKVYSVYSWDGYLKVLAILGKMNTLEPAEIKLGRVYTLEPVILMYLPYWEGWILFSRLF